MATKTREPKISPARRWPTSTKHRLQPMGEQAGGASRRRSGSLATTRAKWRYWSILAGLIIASAAIALGLLAW
ncbi:MAG: hypothetical protein ACTIK2_11970, partial [Brevibacterium aurantiacum]